MKTTLILLTMLAAALISYSQEVTSAQQSAPENDVEVQLKTLYDQWNQSPDRSGWFKKNKERLRPELALKAHEIAFEILQKQQVKTANLLFTFAAMTYLELGDLGGALNDYINSLQVRFMVAEKFEEYETVTKQAFEISSKAESIGRQDLQFNAAVIGADSAYFGSKTKTGLDAEKPIAEALKDCIAALKVVQYATDRLYLERFVSLISATVESATSIPFVATDKSQAEVDELLKQVALGTERAIPTDFQYSDASIGSSGKTIETAHTLAEISYRFGSASSASARLMFAAKRAREAGDIDTWLRTVSLRYSGERRAGMPAVLLEKLRDEAWDSAQQLRLEYRSRAGRIWVAYRTDLFYADMLSDQLNLGAAEPAKTFAAAEMLKARTLLDAIHFPSSGRVSVNNEQLQSQVLGFSTPKTGANDLFMGEMRLVSQLSPFNEMGDELQKRLTALSEVEQAYKQANAGLVDSASIAQLRDIQSALQPREAIIEYTMPFHPLDPAHGLWILLISKNGFHAVRSPLELLSTEGIGFIGRLSVDGEAPIDSSPLDNLVVETRAKIRTSDEKSAKEYLRNLYTLLIRPLIDDGVRLEDYERIVIVPHGMLHYVPFPALIDEKGNFFISKTALTIAPSASIWLALLQRGGPVKQFVGLGNPVLGNGAPELMYSSQELDAVAKEMTAAAPKVFKGLDATKERLVQEAPAANIVHLATHGRFPDDNAMDNHAVLLAVGKEDDGTLTAAGVRQMDLRSSKLTVLSVCNGGLYRMGPADSPFGLIPAFIESGSQNVMGSLWPLDDQFGRDFMIEYYSHLLADGPAKAYQKTVMRFIAEDEFVRNWAGFVLVGPGRPFDATPR